MSFSLPTVFLLPLVFQLTLLLLLGITLRGKGYRPRVKARSNIYRCHQCKKVYIDPRLVPLSKCPVCHTLNEAIRR